MAEETTPDIVAVQDFIKDQVKSAYAEVAAADKARQPAPSPDVDKQLRDQMQQTLDPFIRPSTIMAASAMDHSSFYTRNPEMLEDYEEIERLFEESVRTGRNLGRQDIADYVDGKQRRTKPEEWTKKQEERSAKQKDVAASAVDVGFSAMDKAKNDPNWSNFGSKTIEEMEAALDGVTF